MCTASEMLDSLCLAEMEAVTGVPLGIALEVMFFIYGFGCLAIAADVLFLCNMRVPFRIHFPHFSRRRKPWFGPIQLCTNQVNQSSFARIGMNQSSFADG